MVLSRVLKEKSVLAVGMSVAQGLGAEVYKCFIFNYIVDACYKYNVVAVVITFCITKIELY